VSPVAPNEYHEQLRHLKFQELLAIEPPATFTALWQDDVERHHQLYLPPERVQT
jgi:hypothetical protein